MKTQPLIGTISTCLAGTVFGQSYVPDSSRQYAQD